MDTFTVWQFRRDESYEALLTHVSAEAATRAFLTACSSPGAMLGMIDRVIITDNGDDTVAEWIHGRGLVFPPPPQEPRS